MYVLHFVGWISDDYYFIIESCYRDTHFIRTRFRILYRMQYTVICMTMNRSTPYIFTVQPGLVLPQFLLLLQVFHLFIFFILIFQSPHGFELKYFKYIMFCTLICNFACVQCLNWEVKVLCRSQGDNHVFNILFHVAMYEEQYFVFNCIFKYQLH